MPAAAKTDPPAETPPEPKPEAKVKAGRWFALTNLSRSRPFNKDGDKAADIIHTGETVENFTDEEIHGFLHRHKRPVIRPATDKDPAPKMTARDLFGTPPAPQLGARPDPPKDPDRTVLGLPLGASVVPDSEHAGNAPEANDPVVDMGGNPNAAKDRSAGA
jgi:hypothetical protein